MQEASKHTFGRHLACRCAKSKMPPPAVHSSVNLPYVAYAACGCHGNVVMSGDSKVEMSGTLAPPRHGRLDGDRHESAGVASRGGGVAQVWADQPSGGGTPATAHDAAGAPPTLRRTAELCWRNASLPFTAVERPRRAPAELTRQEVTWPRKWRSISTPRANHPWKTTPIGPRSPEYVNRGSINDLGPDISTLLTPDIFYFARNRTFLLCLDMQRVTACHGNVDGVEFA